MLISFTSWDHFMDGFFVGSDIRKCLSFMDEILTCLLQSVGILPPARISPCVKIACCQTPTREAYYMAAFLPMSLALLSHLKLSFLWAKASCGHCKEISKQQAVDSFLKQVFCLLRVDRVPMHLQTDLLILKTVNNSFFK